MSKNNFIKIASSRSTVEAEQMIQILKESGISAYRQSGIMDIYMGNSTVGEDIMVLEGDKESAQNILARFQPIKTDTTAYSRKFSKGQKIMGWILLAIIILCIVLPLCFL